MGIQNLLQVLKNVTRSVHISELRGKRVAVDGYYWLHRGAYACSKDICTGNRTNKFLGYGISMIEVLESYNITPIIVFDGSPLPSKGGEEADREARRKENMKLALETQRKGDREGAKKYYDRAVDITPRMAFDFIQHLKRRGIGYVVAPFEADAQLAFLYREGIVDAVIAEDSDMIPYGVECVINKLDRNNHECKMILMEDVVSKSDFRDFTGDMIRQACILSGCDYLKSPKKFGLMSAIKAVRATRDGLSAIRNMRYEGKYELPPNYEKEFERAELTFKHQQVYDPRIRQVVPLTPLPEGLSWDVLEPFLGPPVPEDMGRSIAEGIVDPITKLPFAGSVGNPPQISRYNSFSSSSSYSFHSCSSLSPSSSFSSSSFSPTSSSLSSLPPSSSLTTSSSSSLPPQSFQSPNSSSSFMSRSNQFLTPSSLKKRPSVNPSPQSSNSTSSYFSPSSSSMASGLTSSSSPFTSSSSNRSGPFVSPSSFKRRNPTSTPSPSPAGASKTIYSFFKPIPKKTLDFEEEEKAKKEGNSGGNDDDEGNTTDEDDSNGGGGGGGGGISLMKSPYVVNTTSKVLRPFVPPSKKVIKVNSSEGNESDKPESQDTLTTSTKSMLIKSRFFNSTPNSTIFEISFYLILPLYLFRNV